MEKAMHLLSWELLHAAHAALHRSPTATVSCGMINLRFATFVISPFIS